MHPATGDELATARIADLRRAGRPRRFGKQLWTLLHAQVLLDGLAAAAGSISVAEDSYRRAARSERTPR
jgi:hypothetical protein